MAAHAEGTDAHALRALLLPLRELVKEGTVPMQQIDHSVPWRGAAAGKGG